MFTYLLDLTITIKKNNNSRGPISVINFILFVFLGRYGIKEFASPDFVPLLESSIEKQKISDGIPLSKQHEISKWISEIWHYLSKNEELIEKVQHLHILAETEGEKNVSVVQLHVLDGLYVLKRQGSSSISGAVCEGLQSFGVTLLNALPGFMPNASVERYVCSPTTSGVCDVMVKLLRKTTNERYLIQKFEELSASKRKKLAVFMSQANDMDDTVKNFLKELKIFPIQNHNTLCSVSEVDKITPLKYAEYPISHPDTMIDGNFKGIQLAIMLGCSRWTDEELTLDILTRTKDNEICEKDKIDAFMDFFLSRIQFATPKQIEVSTLIPFIESEDGKRRKPQELFEITENLENLFYEEKDRLPRNRQFVNKHINGLKTLGLKSSVDISINDLIKTLNFIIGNDSRLSNEIKLKIKTFENLANRLVNPSDLQNENYILEKMRSSSWMPPKTKKPKHYPQKMLWLCREDKLQSPDKMYHSEYEMFVGSVALVAKSSLNSELLDYLLHQKPSSDLVLKQLLLLSENYNDCTNRSEFLPMLTAIYNYLANERLQQSTVDVYREKNIVWTGNVFAKPKDVFIDFINNSTEKVTLEPYMYQIQPENEKQKNLFLQLGCLDEIEIENILNILCDIKECQKSLSLEKSKHNLLVVEGILNVLEEQNDKNLLSGVEIDRILFPVKTRDNLFELLPAKECTYVDYKRENDEIEDDEEDLKFVHTKIRSSLAENLGVPSLTRRIVEIKGVEDIPWGQKEELTDRLKNLIEEYADGISVLKEMLQNADDAGATCLHILYDERTNENAKTGLIDKGMAECQGPAIWVYNDAKFEEKDFQNIIKLGAGTKMADLTKIGKFGLGFCSVYNITDVPSILSGDSLVILDPRMIHLGKALKDDNPGLRFRISDSKTRRRLRHQLRPYNGIFDCDFQSERPVMSYEGTLFRFPLRTAKQADETKRQISPKQYTKDDVAKLIYKFIEDAGNLMLFIQNVKKIEFFHLHPQALEPHPVYSITRCSQNGKSNILVQANPNLDIERKQPIQTVENICISIKVQEEVEQLHHLFKQEKITENASDTKWVIVWQIGTNAQTLPYTHTKNNVIVGGIAIPVMHSLLQCTEVEQSAMPFGYYPHGHVFCFLPLPQESYIPVHVNGYFAVESSRRRLVSKSSDNLISEGADWNIFLLRNVICDSYLCLLEKLADLFYKGNCYENWPHQGKDNMINELVISFYEKLVTSKRKLIFRYQDSSNNRRYSFKECVFLNPVLRYESEDKICEKALECFLRFNSYEPEKHAMDLPKGTYEQLKMIPTCDSLLKENICDLKTFYLDSFFPSLSTEFWNQSTEERNKLILLAFESENEEVKHVIKKTQCIPTLPDGKLRKPSELINPDLYNNSFCISRLFYENDERFPSEEFSKLSIVKELKTMGMMTDTLTDELVIDRVKSVKRLAQQAEKMSERCNYMLQYLELKMETHKQVQPALQNIKFLPVLQKPSNWPFKWYAIESKKFESGKKLCLKNCKNVAGCVSSIVNLDGRYERVLKYLGVQGTEDIYETVLRNQFEEITRITPSEKFNEIWEIYRDVYAYFNDIDCSFLSTFEDQCCLLTKSGLVKPNASALELRCDLEPFLFKVDDRWKKYENFLRCIGVKKTFSVHCLFETLKTIDLKEGETSEHVSKIIDILNMLSDTKRRGGFQSICDRETVLLPDTNKIMRKPSDLCIDDGRDIDTKDNSFLFVHGELNANTTSLFGIKSKCAQFIKRSAVAVSFGQSEALVTRLKGILEDYPCNVSILNELIQNADDAGATEIHFVHDQRSHPTDLIFDKTLADTQGPSLVVYNNSCFSKSDIEGISKLGEGSKRLDPMTTGQFGIGFNAVYHITDVPSFLTIGETVPNGGALVMFDPHCDYVPLATPQNPGMMIEDIQCIQKNFPDMYQAYLTEEISRSTGTWFRFPLRTTAMAKKSKIKSKFNLTNQTLQLWFSSLEADIPKSLLFLSNIVNISLSVISSDDQIQQIASVSAKRAPTVKEKLQKFNSDAKRYVDSLRSGEISLTEKGVSAQYEQELNISIKDKTCKETWCVSQVCGVYADGTVDKTLLESFKSKEIALSPRGGVAFEITLQSDYRSSTAFNFLPLDIKTNLAVHVNGHFAVNSARTSIWENNKPQGHLKGIWNSFLLEHVIPFAYIELVCFLRENLFQNSEMNIEHTICVYNNSFPILKTVENTRWKILIERFYQLALDQKVEIFPIFLPSDVCGSVCESNHFLIKKMYKVPSGACVSFVSLKIENHQFPSYLCPPDSKCVLISSENELWFDSDLATLLKLLGLKLLDCSRDIAESVQSTLQMPESVLPCLCITDIMEFLRSWKSNAVDKCRISKVGVPITETLFKDIKTLGKIVKVCFGLKTYEHPEDLEGIPLCIQNDNVLQVFSKINKKFVSEFCDLFPNSSQQFLHVEFVSMFHNKLQKTLDFLMPLDIEHFSKLLSDDFGNLHSNKPIPLIENAQNEKWFSRCWEFLSVSNQMSNIKTYDDFLSSWCLIPVETRSKRELYPFKMRFAILDARSFFEATGDVSNEDQTIGKFLSNLDIPSPFLKYIGKSFKKRQTVRSLCASKNSPEIILDCMIYHKNCCLETKNAKNLLVFLYNKLRNDFSKLKSKFREVNLYKSFDGTLTNLDTTGDIIILEAGCVPTSGLGLFCQDRNLKILENNVYLYELYEKLSLERIASISFYERYLLRYPENLDHETRMRHIHHINKNCLFKKGSDLMKRLIKDFPFVKNAKTKRLQRVCDFFTPYPRICRRMFTDEELLPLDPFKDEEWKDLLYFAGLKTNIPVEMYLRFARNIERRQEKEKDQNLYSDSKLLLNEILKIPNIHKEEQFLRQLREVKFIIPYKVKRGYLEILCAFNTASLISFENAVYPENELLTWSMCNILPDLKWQDKEHSLKVEEKLLIKRIPDLRDVISHVHKLCDNIYLAVKIEQTNIKLVENVGELHEFMELIYTKLKNMAVSARAVKEMEIGFSETPLFYNDKKNCFLRWDQMVLELRREDEISTHLCRGSEIYGAHFDFFRKLGVTNEATYFHYVRVFHVLKSLIGDRPLMGEELSLCQKAMNGLLESVKKLSNLSITGEENFDKLNEFPCVYIPTDANRLEKSFDLTICDIPDFEERLVGVNDIQFVKRAHSSYSRNKLLLLLPSNFRPKCISQQVKEVVCKKDGCQSSEEIRNLNKRVHKKEFMDALFAILSQSKISGSEKENYRAKLERLHFELVSNLETILVFKSNGVEIQGSSKPKEIFYDPDDSIVFIKIKQGTRSLFRYVRDLAFDVIVKCTSDVANRYKTEIIRLLESETVDEINEVLSSLKVSVEPKWEPELGSYVPEDLHEYLENSIQDLRPSEIVALEILNPAFDAVEDYVYIYVKVIKKTDTNMFPMYEIYDGLQIRPEIAFKLYRFVPAENGTSSQELERYTDLGGEVYQTRKGVIFNEIKRTLIEAWKYDERDFRRVKNRLLLNWHPDRHPNNPLATEITQYILEIWRRLKNGEFKEQVQNCSESFTRQRNFYYRHRQKWKGDVFYGERNPTHAQPRREDDDDWLDGYANRRRHRRRRHYSGWASYGGGRRTSSAEYQPNPQPQVGKLWLKQAKYNMRAARMEMDQSVSSDWDNGRNWICYKCHLVGF